LFLKKYFFQTFFLHLFFVSPERSDFLGHNIQKNYFYAKKQFWKKLFLEKQYFFEFFIPQK
jgi:hypothetical protein